MRKKIINLQNELLHIHNKILSLKEKKDHHNFMRTDSFLRQ